VADEQARTQRVQAVLTSLLERRLGESLRELCRALEPWQRGDLSVLEAHAEVLRHAARAENLAQRMARIGPDAVASHLRDAFDAELLGREEFIELTGLEPEKVEPPPALADTVSAELPSKRRVVEELLGSGPVLVHVDACRPEVDVPERFRSDPRLVLRFGYDLTPAIIDLAIDDDAIVGTLSFGGVPHRCVLPWSSVYAVVSEIDQKGMVWPDDVPAAVAEQLTGGENESESESEMKPSRRGGHLKLVK
jgi:stringent starvation protein B